MSEFGKINLNLFKILEISENNIDLLTYRCDICNKNSSTVSIFDTCNHNCCVLCSDYLYDSYLNKDSSIMFECPFCNSKVYDIIYKK
jgi:hypothetical protein